MEESLCVESTWLARTKQICPRCDIPVHKGHLGKTNRRSFFCTHCHKLYTDTQ